jgi:hypothetical protein
VQKETGRVSWPKRRPASRAGPSPGESDARAKSDVLAFSLRKGIVGMHDQSDHGANLADQAIEDLKKSVDQAIIQTEDAMEKIGYDVSAAAQVTEDYRAKVFDYMRGNVNAAIDYASNLATLKSPADLAAGLLPPNSGNGAAPPDLTAAATAAEEYRQRMFAFMKANMNSALDYAQQLATVKSPSELVELSTSHARKQFETMTAQSTELGMLAQKFTAWNTDALSSFSNLSTFSKMFDPTKR